MTRLLLAALLFPILLSAQKPDCKPHRGTTTVCDSVYQLCRKSAYQVALVDISKPTSPWYDSLYCPEELIARYTTALCAFYNDLHDTLADFRMYLQYHSQLHPDSAFTTTVEIPHQAMDSVFDRRSASGCVRIDSLMKAWGFEIVSFMTLHSLTRSVIYRNKNRVNRAFVERRLQAIHPRIEMSGVYHTHFQNLMELSVEGNRVEIITMELSACMPPEIPCTYIRRTFVHEEKRLLRHAKFERGTLPWPRLPGEH